MFRSGLQNEPVLALLIHDTTTNTLLNPFQQRQQSYYILLSDFQIRQNEAMGYPELTTLFQFS